MVLILISQIVNGCSDLKKSDGIYKHNSTAAELQHCISEVCIEDALKRIKHSPLVDLMLDESIDIAVQKKLVLFFNILVLRKAKIEFAANVEFKDGKAETIYSAVLNYLNSYKIPVKKLSGLGTDGTSVMTGCHNGLLCDCKG